jgi:hypothetical protein
MSKSSLLASYKSFLEKTAATRALKIIRSLANAGKYTDAENFAKKLIQRGGLKTTPQGSQVKYVGGGAETPSHLVIGAKVPKRPNLPSSYSVNPAKFDIRKTISPWGALYSKESAGDAFNAMRRLSSPPKGTRHGNPLSRGNPNFAKLLSRKIHKTPTGGRFYHQEFVPDAMTLSQAKQQGHKLSHSARTALNSISAARGSTMSKSLLGDLIRPKGMGGKDTGKRTLGDWAGNPENILINKKTGLPKAVDFFVSPKSPTERRLLSQGGMSSPGKPPAHPYSRYQGKSRQSEILENALAQLSARRGQLDNAIAGGGGPKDWRGAMNSLRDMKNAVAKRQKAEYWRRWIPGAQAKQSDFIPTGIRKVDPAETLKGLGPGSPRKGGKVRAARKSSGKNTSPNQSIDEKAAGPVTRQDRVVSKILKGLSEKKKPLTSVRQARPRTGVDWTARPKTIPPGRPLTPSIPPGGSRPGTVDPLGSTYKGIGTADTVNLRGR